MYERLVLQQFEFEVESWSRMLHFIAQENDSFKNRLAQVVNNEQVETDLPQFEYFNEEFLSQDKILDYLNTELKKHQTVLNSGLPMPNQLVLLKTNQEKLRREIKVEEDLFQHLKDNFADYLISCTKMSL